MSNNYNQYDCKTKPQLIEIAVKFYKNFKRFNPTSSNNLSTNPDDSFIYRSIRCVVELKIPDQKLRRGFLSCCSEAEFNRLREELIALRKSQKKSSDIIEFDDFLGMDGEVLQNVRMNFADDLTDSYYLAGIDSQKFQQKLVKKINQLLSKWTSETLNIDLTELIQLIEDKNGVDVLLRELIIIDDSLMKLIMDLNAVENETNNSNSAKKPHETADIVVAATATVISGATSINQAAEMSADLSNTPEIKQATLNNKVKTLFNRGWLGSGYLLQDTVANMDKKQGLVPKEDFLSDKELRRSINDPSQVKALHLSIDGSYNRSYGKVTEDNFIRYNAKPGVQCNCSKTFSVFCHNDMSIPYAIATKGDETDSTSVYGLKSLKYLVGQANLRLTIIRADKGFASKQWSFENQHYGFILLQAQRSNLKVYHQYQATAYNIYQWFNSEAEKMNLPIEKVMFKSSLREELLKKVEQIEVDEQGKETVYYVFPNMLDAEIEDLPLSNENKQGVKRTSAPKLKISKDNLRFFNKKRAMIVGFQGFQIAEQHPTKSKHPYKKQKTKAKGKKSKKGSSQVETVLKQRFVEESICVLFKLEYLEKAEAKIRASIAKATKTLTKEGIAEIVNQNIGSYVRKIKPKQIDFKPIKGDPVKVEKCWKQLINGSTQVITCNLSDVNPEFIFRGYFQRQEIERSFHILKNYLNLMPLHVTEEEAIKGRNGLVVITYNLLIKIRDKIAEFLGNEDEIPSLEQIIKGLRQVQYYDLVNGISVIKADKPIASLILKSILGTDFLVLTSEDKLRYQRLGGSIVPNSSSPSSIWNTGITLRVCGKTTILKNGDLSNLGSKIKVLSKS